MTIGNAEELSASGSLCPAYIPDPVLQRQPKRHGLVEGPIDHESVVLAIRQLMEPDDGLTSVDA